MPCFTQTVAGHGSPYAAAEAANTSHRVIMRSDDTSVAILDKHDAPPRQSVHGAALPAATLHFHEKITANNKEYLGVHPVVAVESHRQNLATLITKALQSLPDAPSASDDPSSTIRVRAGSGWTRKRKPDLVSVTRGPGMRSCLAAGIDTAKGLAVGWQVPVVGVNHMQAHALTPRLVSAMAPNSTPVVEPAFPFLSLLVSGGHTLLLHSTGLIDHTVLATTSDMAIGDAVDKMARVVVPTEIIRQSDEIMYGRLLEQFAFPLGEEEHAYAAPATRKDELARNITRWGWAIGAPLAETRSGSKSKSMEYSFSGLGSAVKRIADNAGAVLGIDERKDLAREAMRLAFEHLASRVVIALEKLRAKNVNSDLGIGTLVVSGGVASNSYLRTILRSFLDVRGFSHMQLSFPPPSLCTDNAAMIAWAGIETFEAGWESKLDMTALRKWSLDPRAGDGGILGVGSWKKIESNR
ncbi:probable o-sialoglycoprotein endopeptidase [Lasallia pustulata]|uniref:N(6)-L-threonylcarbamoyladenine synthase n=1 Tax=Lasallia pustulata TaxID=136370 RepID=A0A1W5CUN2_9LECA|nr:probable o-sialoglycoprotein endopeptidase [Lasallia pustulata]